MKTIEIQHGRLVYAFCVDGQQGNPAFVFTTLPGEQINIDTCVDMAARLQSQVTWIQHGKTSSGISLRFFTPGGEIKFCGHGVLAAAAWLFHEVHTNNSFTFSIAGSTMQVERDRLGRWSYRQQEFASRPIESDAELAEAAHAMGLSSTQVTYENGARLGRSCGALREKLFVELPDKSYLETIAIDAYRRDALCERHGVTGIYAFTIYRDERNPRVLARHFPIHCGEQEDMATGGIAPTAIRYAGLSLEEGEVIIEQGGPSCRNARLIVANTASVLMRRIAGECVVGDARLP